jgi:hypothetical protein
MISNHVNVIEVADKMDGKQFKLYACINTSSPSVVKPVLVDMVGNDGSVRTTSEGLIVEAMLRGENIADLNRMFLSQLRRVEKKAIVRTIWTKEDRMETPISYMHKSRIR